MNPWPLDAKGARAVARRGRASLAGVMACDNGGCRSLNVARCLPQLAPSLARPGPQTKDQPPAPPKCFHRSRQLARRTMSGSRPARKLAVATAMPPAPASTDIRPCLAQ